MFANLIFSRRALPTIVVVGAAVLIAVGCGGAGGDDASGIVPTRAALVVQIDVRHDTKGQVAQLRRTLRNIPAYPLIDGKVPGPQRIIDQLLLLPGGKVNLDWAVDIKPWLGDTAGMAGWFDPKQSGGVPIDAFVWFDTTDEQAALNAAEKTFGEPGRDRHRDIEVLHATNGKTTVYWAAVDGRLVIAREAGPVEAAIEANQGESVEESSDWKRLTKQRAGHEPLLLMHGTPALWRQVRDAMQEADVIKPAQREQIEQALGTYEYSARSFTFSIGATGDSLWFDWLAIGDTPAPRVEDGAARRQLEGLPDSAVAAVGMTDVLLDEHALESARDQFGQMRGQLDGLTDGAFADATMSSGTQRRVAGAIEAAMDAYEVVLSEEFQQQSADAYVGSGALALLAKGGEIAFVSSVGVKDAEAARVQVGREVQLVNSVLAEFTDVRVRSSRAGERTTLTLTGVPTKQLQQRLHAAAGSSSVVAKIAKSPLVREFLRPTLSGGIDTTDDVERLGVPVWGLDALNAAAAGTSTLGEDQAFRADMQVAKPARDAKVVAWFDIDELVRQVLEPIDGQISFIVDAQLSKVGGPVFWSTAASEGGDTISRSAFEVPLYE